MSGYVHRLCGVLSLCLPSFIHAHTLLFICVCAHHNHDPHCYDHVTPRDGNAHSFSKEQMRGGTSALEKSAQDRPIIKQAPDRCQSDSLPRQRNNKSLRQAQTLREWEIQRPREGGVWSKNHQTPTTADRHHAVPVAADQRFTAQMRTQTTMTRLKAVES
jgi:hypothetical protein